MTGKNATNDIPTTSTRYLPVAKWNEYHAWPTPAGLRWLIFNAKTNGFEKCIRRVGRRVLISEADFFDFIEKRSQVQG